VDVTRHPEARASASYLIFLRAEEDRDAAEFKRFCLDRLGEALIDGGLGTSTLIVNISVSEPEELRLQDDSAERRAPYDAVLQVECAQVKGGLRTAAGHARWKHRALWHEFRITKTTIKDDGRVRTGRPSNGIKMIHPLRFHADMPDSAVRRSWANHANLAVKVHRGASRYCQNWVEERLDSRAPPYRGASELHFPSLEELVEGYFDSPRGRDEIVQDIGHFIVGRPPRIFTHEHVLLG
jgi:hypothetical protein